MTDPRTRRTNKELANTIETLSDPEALAVLAAVLERRGWR